MGYNLETLKPFRTDQNTFWITAKKYGRGKRTSERWAHYRVSLFELVRGPCLGIRASLEKVQETQGTVENPRARINTGVNTVFMFYITLLLHLWTFTDSFLHIQKRKLIFFKSGFLCLSSIDIWSWKTLHECYPAHYKIFSSIAGLVPLDVSHTTTLQLWRQMPTVPGKK